MWIDISQTENNSSWFHSTHDLFDAWEKWERAKPEFIYEITEKTEQKLSININHWDVIKIEDGIVTVYWIVYDLGKNGKKVKLDWKIKWIDSIAKVWASIFKIIARFQTQNPETFEGFLQRFEQKWTTALEKNSSTENDYNDIHWEENKWENHEFIENPNIWWKLHICVSHTGIQKVYDFLKWKDYYFKCLSWGDGIEKTFTIYTGSFRKTQEIAQELEEIKKFLKRPVGVWIEREIEFWPWVLGRFCTSEYSNVFQRYGIVWMDMIQALDGSKNYLSELNRKRIGFRDPNLIQQARSTFQALSSIFWSYFHG